MRKLFALLLCIFMLTTMAACSSDKGTVKRIDNYSDFYEKITDKDFTGFAYVLSSNDAATNDYLSSIKDVVKKQGKTVIYFDDTKASKQEHEQFNEDSRNVDVYPPDDDIAYIKKGKIIDAFDIDKHIKEDEKKKELAAFLEKYSE